MKNVIMQVAYVFNGSMANLLFIGKSVVLLPYKKYLVTIFSLKSKLSGKFQHVNANDERIETLKIVEFPKFSIKIESFKTFYESHLTNKLPEKKLFSLLPDKSFLRVWNKNFLTEI